MAAWTWGKSASWGTRGRTKWWLTTRDRHSHNVGAMLTQTSPQLEVPFDLELEIPLMTPACADEGETAVRDDAKAMQMDPSMTEYVSKRHPPSSTDSWSDPTHAVANPTTIGKSGSGGG